MGTVFGSSTADYKMYNNVMDKVKEMGIEVEILENQEYQVQRIEVITDDVSSHIDTLNGLEGG